MVRWVQLIHPDSIARAIDSQIIYRRVDFSKHIRDFRVGAHRRALPAVVALFGGAPAHEHEPVAAGRGEAALDAQVCVVVVAVVAIVAIAWWAFLRPGSSAVLVETDIARKPPSVAAASRKRASLIEVPRAPE